WGWELTQRSQRTGTGDDEHWTSVTVANHRGNKLGWVDDDKVYLLPEATLAEVQRLANNCGQHLPLNDRTLGKALYNAGFLVQTELESRGRYSRRLMIHGK